MKKLINKMWISASPMAIFLVLVISVIPLSAFEAHVVNVTAKIERRPCVLFETRSFGFWKNHPEVRVYPQTLGEEVVATSEETDAVFGLPNNIMMNKLQKQLLALKFKISFYNSGTALAPGENTTVNELVVAADAMITASSSPSENELEDMKDRLESANTDGTLSTCPNDKDDENGGHEDDDDDDEDDEDEEHEDDKDKGDKDDKDKDKDKNKSAIIIDTATSTDTTTLATTTEETVLEEPTESEVVETETEIQTETEVETTEAEIETETTTTEPEPAPVEENSDPALIIN